MPENKRPYSRTELLDLADECGIKIRGDKSVPTLCSALRRFKNKSKPIPREKSISSNSISPPAIALSQLKPFKPKPKPKPSSESDEEYTPSKSNSDYSDNQSRRTSTRSKSKSQSKSKSKSKSRSKSRSASPKPKLKPLRSLSRSNSISESRSLLPSRPDSLLRVGNVLEKEIARVENTLQYNHNEILEIEKMLVTKRAALQNPTYELYDLRRRKHINDEKIKKYELDRKEERERIIEKEKRKQWEKEQEQLREKYKSKEKARGKEKEKREGKGKGGIYGSIDQSWFC